MNLFRSKFLPLVCLAASIPAALAVDKGGTKFTPPPVDSIESKQTNDSVTIAVKPYNNETDAKAAFGRVNPYEYGILPVLVIIRNDSKKSIRLSTMRPEYISPSRDRIEATPASEVKYARGPKRPSMNPGPIPGIKLKGKNPLAAEEIEGRAFSAQMLPPGEMAYGFIYFHTGFRRGASFYLTGLQDASTGQDLFYFDIPMQ
jgi:hypothetical protein